MPKTAAADGAGDDEEQQARVLRLIRAYHTEVPKPPVCSCALLADVPPTEESGSSTPKPTVMAMLYSLKETLQEKSAVSGSLMAKLDWMERECQAVIGHLQEHTTPRVITSARSRSDRPSTSGPSPPLADHTPPPSERGDHLRR